MPYLTDNAAKDQAIRSWGMPECLHVPTAAVNEEAIIRYIGKVVRVLAKGPANKALLVEVKDPPPIDTRLPIWKLKESSIFHNRMQVWVHVAYTRYRQAYRRAFPTEDIAHKILSHALNRRMAVLQGFQYVRITPISRSSNSSSGFSENWGVALYRKPEELQAHKRRGVFIHYADLSSLMVMLDLKLGGGLMDAVNEGQKLVRPEA